MPEFKCSSCDYISVKKCHAERHIYNNLKCKELLSTITTIDIDFPCEHCKKTFTLKSNLDRHLKTCKFKNTVKDEEIIVLKEKLSMVENFNEYKSKLNKKYEELKDVNEKNEKIIESLVKTNSKKILGNTPVETIRSQARKKYKEIFKDMKCVHCKHEGSTQVCHIKAISEFSKISEIEEINEMSNLIGLCPNCHVDLDKHKKFEVTRTAKLHSMLVLG